jgi:peptidoglycan hydrolase CwlO-like protein
MSNVSNDDDLLENFNKTKSKVFIGTDKNSDRVLVALGIKSFSDAISILSHVHVLVSQLKQIVADAIKDQNFTGDQKTDEEIVDEFLKSLDEKDV